MPQQLQQHWHCPAAHRHMLFSNWETSARSWDDPSEHSSDLSFEAQSQKAGVVSAYTHCVAEETVVAGAHATWAQNLQLQRTPPHLLYNAAAAVAVAAAAADASSQQAD